MSFLEWMDANVADADHEFDFGVNTQEEYNKMIAAAFPYADFELNIRKVEYEYCKSLYIKAKFSGGAVMTRYGLQGKELGDALTGFKKITNNIFGDETYEDYIINNDVEQIYCDFNEYLKPKEASV